MERRGIEIDADAEDERQDEADREAEGVEERQHVEDLVGAAEVDPRRALGGIGEDVAVGEDDALRHALGAGGEEDRGGIVGARGRASGRVADEEAAEPVEEGHAGADILEVDDLDLRRSSAATRVTSLAFSTKAREVTMVFTSAARAGGEDVGRGRR